MRTRTSTMPVIYPSGSLNYRRHDNVPGGCNFGNPLVENVVTNTPSLSDSSPGGNASSITDELSFGKREGYCLHHKSELKVFSFESPVSGQVCAGVPFTGHAFTIYGGYLAYTYLRTRIDGLAPSYTFNQVRWSDMSYYALKAMKPKFSDLSLANDLLELNQIKDIAKPYGNAKSRLGKAANEKLWYSFGVKPVVDDIIDVYHLIRSLSGKISEIRRRGRRLQTRHYSRPIDSALLPGDSTSTIENAGDFREVNITFSHRWVIEPTYHATLKFRYDVSSLTDLELRIQAWSQAFGIDKPLSVAWNAIPFSFVVDWFVDVGEWIDSLQAEPVLPIVIEDFSHSAKYSFRSSANLEFWKGVLLSPIGSGEHSYYERRRDLPSTVAPLNVRFPTIEQITLGAALLVQGHESRKLRENKPTRTPPKPKWLKVSNKQFKQSINQRG